mgnify:CR=1 FL=1
MSEFTLTAYILVWPIVSTAILVLLVVTLIKDIRNARKSGKGMI